MAGTDENADERLDKLFNEFPFHSKRLGPLAEAAYRYPGLPYPEFLVAVRRVLEHHSRTGHNVLIHG
jgi:hypothetical protein